MTGQGQLTWHHQIHLHFPGKNFLNMKPCIIMPKGLGAARSGNVNVTKDALYKLEALQKSIGDSPQTKYWYNQLEAQKRAVKSLASCFKRRYGKCCNDDAICSRSRGINR
jgi:hypothetical protein